MPHALQVSTQSSGGTFFEKAASTSHVVTVGRKVNYAITPFDIKIIFNGMLKPSSSINEISSIITRMIDWRVLYLQENHGDRIVSTFKALSI